MSSLYTAHSAVGEGSPTICHFTSFLRGLRSQRNFDDTQQLDHTQGLSQSSEKSTIDREKGKWARQSPLSKLLTPLSVDKKNLCTAQRFKSYMVDLEHKLFCNCEVALPSHICFPIKLVFHQHLNSHIDYPGSPPESSNHTRGQFLHMPSYPLRRVL